MFYSISQLIEKTHGIQLKEADIFLLYGGISFQIEKLENARIPQYEINGSYLVTETFNKTSGFLAKKLFEASESDAFQTTLECFANQKPQLVYANCFYLPYDEANYRQNYDNHFLLVEGFDETTDEFIVSDENGRHRVLRNDFYLARNKTYSNSFESLSISIENQSFIDEYPKRRKQLLIQNAVRFESELAASLEQFNRILNSLGEVEIFFKWPAIEGVSRGIKHPRGLISTREFMAVLLKDMGEHELSDRYLALSKRWLRLSNDLLRYALDNKPFSQIQEVYNSISEEELWLNDQVAKI